MQIWKRSITKKSYDMSSINSRSRDGDSAIWTSYLNYLQSLWLASACQMTPILLEGNIEVSFKSLAHPYIMSCGFISQSLLLFSSRLKSWGGGYKLCVLCCYPTANPSYQLTNYTCTVSSRLSIYRLGHLFEFGLIGWKGKILNLIKHLFGFCFEGIPDLVITH